MSDECYQCKRKFFYFKNVRSVNKYRMSKLLTVKASNTLYNEQFTKEDISKLFLCEICLKSIREVTVSVHKGAHKRCIIRGENYRNPVPKEKKTHPSKDVLNKVCQHIKTYQYGHAIRCLIKNIPAAKNALIKVLHSVVQDERIKLRHSQMCLSQELTEETINNFRWGNAISDCRKVAPATVTCLEAMFPKPQTMTRHKMYGKHCNRRRQTVEEAKEEVVVRQGMMLAVALYTCRPKKFRFVQACIGVELWRHGAPEKLFKSFNRLGICQRGSPARCVVDRLCRYREEAALAWKKGVESNINGNQSIEEDVEGRLCLYRHVPTLGYGLCWDNVQLTAQLNLPQHNEPIENSFGPWAVCFAVDNRLEPPVDGGGEKAASTLPAYSFVPGPRDYWELRKYMISVVKRILIENFSFLGSLGKRIKTRVNHRYTTHLTEKSHVISLGVMDVSPSSDSGSAGVISKLQQYVPRKAGVPSPLVCCGDGLSVEQMIQSHTGQELSVEQMIQSETGQEISVEQMIQSETGPEISVEQMIHPHREQELSVEQMIQSETGPELSVEQMIQSETGTELSVEQTIQSETEPELIVEHMIQSETGQEWSVEQIIQLDTGQELSVEQIIQSHTRQENGNTGERQFIDLIPAPKESRKEIILLQDFMDTFIRKDSTCSRGTLASLKTYFERYCRCPRTDVQSNFQPAWDLMELATCGYVAVHAMEVMGISKQDDIPDSYPTNFLGQKAWLDRVCMEVVDFVWLAPNIEDIKKVAESVAHGDEVTTEGVFPDCLEGPEAEERMRRCCSALCPTSWSRHSNTRLTDSEEDWYCSRACEKDRVGSYVYCKCKHRKKDTMIQCYLEGDCKRHEWYHKGCVVPAHDPIPGYRVHKVKSGKGLKTANNGPIALTYKWYCSDECALGCEGDDLVQNYSRQLMWDGLNALVRRDAVREGNGTAIVSHWKMDMIQFHNRNHSEHLIIGAHFLAGVAGFYKEGIGFNLTWNRLANISGRAGSNISMDLVNESRYSELKERMFFYHGLYNEKEIHRRWQTCGEFGKSIGRLCAKADCANSESGSELQIRKNTGDVRRFLREFQKDGLTHYLPGRYHRQCRDFTCNTAVKEPCDLGRKIGSICVKLDNWRALSTT